TINVESTIISGNSASSGEPGIFGGFSNGWVNAKSSVIQSMTGTINDQGGNLPMGTDPNLDVLANYGGPMPVHALKSGSAAIDVGSNPDGLAYDQRGAGYPRVAGIKVDMGAYEFYVAPPTVTTVVLDDGNGGINPQGIDGKL